MKFLDHYRVRDVFASFECRHTPIKEIASIINKAVAELEDPDNGFSDMNLSLDYGDDSDVLSIVYTRNMTGPEQVAANQKEAQRVKAKAEAEFTEYYRLKAKYEDL